MADWLANEIMHYALITSAMIAIYPMRNRKR
jgi:hypothetical protein